MANNNAIFNAVLSGASGGFQQRWLTSNNISSYDNFNERVEQIAITVDSLIAPTSIDQQEANLMQSIAQGVFTGRFPENINDYEEIAEAIVALYTNLSAALLPVSGGGGSVDSVFGRAGDVTAQAGDYDSDLIGNASGVAGATVSIALNTLAAGIIALSALVSNTADGLAPQTNGIAGQALISTPTGSAWGTDFGAQALTTTNAFISNSNAPVLRLGLAPGSGAGSAASIGDIRLRNNVAGTGCLVYGRNNADTQDIFLWGYNSATPGLQIGNSAIALALIDMAATTISIGGTTSVILGNTGSAIRVDANTFNFNSSSTAPVIAQLSTAAATVTCQPLSIAAQSGGGNTAVTGGALEIAAGNATGTAGTHTGGATVIRGGDATGAAGTRNGGNITIRPGNGASAQGTGNLATGGSTNRFSWDSTGLSFFAVAPVARQNITGSRGGNAALADLLTKLALTGLITDGTSA